jgi:hypothetical protein
MRTEAPRRAAHDMGQVGIPEGWHDEVEGAALNDVQEQIGIHTPRYYNDLHPDPSAVGQSEHIRPSTIGQVCVGKDELRGLWVFQELAGLLAVLRPGGLNPLSLKDRPQRRSRDRLGHRPTTRVSADSSFTF